MTIENDKKRLTLSEHKARMLAVPGMLDMVTVYDSRSESLSGCGLYAALIPMSDSAKALKNPSWDLYHGQGRPSLSVDTQPTKGHAQYHRFGGVTAAEPLIIDREFHGLRENYFEVSEEFRLFHNLYFERSKHSYIMFDNAGAETTVAQVEPGRARIRLKEILQYCSVRELCLSIQFDCTEGSQYSLTEMGLEASNVEHSDATQCWSYALVDGVGLSEYNSFSRLIGKVIIKSPAKEESGIWPYDDEVQREYADYIVAVDKSGKLIRHSSNPKTLSDLYLTPVMFDKSVLDRYYSQPSKYRVEDGLLWCGTLWNLTIDNHLDDYVTVWLGDLGRDLPESEQYHWLSHNVAGRPQVSGTHLKRQLLAQFADSSQVEHRLKSSLKRLAAACDEHLKWRLLLPLDRDDSHLIHSIRVPAKNEQRDFDEQILVLAKVLIDSINLAELRRIVPEQFHPDGSGHSISLLEVALERCGFTDHQKHTNTLRRVQSLRSAGSAHRKGGQYRKLKSELGLDEQPRPVVLRALLEKLVHTVDYLATAVAKFNAVNEAN